MPYQPEIVVTPTQQYPQVELQSQGYPYTTWGQILGAPYITVSSKGIANGLSVYKNDGAMFGPDSLGTETGGVQEVVSYVMSIGGGTIVFSSGIFDVTNAPFQPDSATSANVTLDAQILIPPTPNQNTVKIKLIGQGTVSGLEEKVALNAIGANSGTVIQSLAPLQSGNAKYIFASAQNPLNPTSQNYVDLFIDQITFISSQSSNVGAFSGRWLINMNGGSFSAITNAPAVPTTLNTCFVAVLFGSGSEGQSDIHFDMVKIEGFQTGLSIQGWTKISKLVLMYIVTGIYPIGNDNFIMEIDNVSCQMTNTFFYNVNSIMAIKIGLLAYGDLTTDTSYPYYYQYIFKSNGNLIADVTAFAQHGGITISNSLTSTDVVRFRTIGPQLALSPTLSANPPVSGTVYQNTNNFDIEIDLPVYATTSGTAGYVTVAKGSTDTPTAIGNQYVSGDTSDTSEQIIRLRVPANWYYEFTASGVTFGTASVFAD